MSNTTPATPATPTTPATSTTPASTPEKKKSATRFITPALVLVAVLGVGVFGGVMIGQNSAETTQAGGFGGGMPGGTNGGTAPDGATGAAMGGFTSGTVVSVDGSTIVLETSDGEQVTITASDDTTVTTTEDSSVDALAEGDELTVIGEADDAGDVTATSISEGATAGFGGGGFGSGTPPTGDTTETE